MVVIEIPQRLPSLNEYTKACNRHWSKGAQMKRETQDVISWCITAAKTPRFEGQVDIRIVFREPNRKRDKDNVMSAQKFILDALQEMGIIKGDGWKRIRDTRCEVVYDKDHPGVMIAIREVNDTCGT